MGGKPKVPTLREVQVKHFIQKYLSKRFEKESDEVIAKSLRPQVSKAAVHHARADGRSIGDKMITAIANAACAGSFDRLYAEAAELAKRDGVKVSAATLADDPELAAAIHFLSASTRGPVPDEFLRPWATARNDAGWKGMSRFDFMQMMYGAWLGKLTPATQRLDADRTRKLPPKKA